MVLEFTPKAPSFEHEWDNFLLTNLKMRQMNHTSNRKVFSLLFTFFSVAAVFGQDGPEARKYSNDFLKIGVGARALGMGSAQVAVASDVTAGYWNPAGLAGNDAIGYPEVAAMHAAYFANIANYNHIGLSLPLDDDNSRFFGVTLIRLGIDDIPNTLQLVEPDGTINYDAVRSFSVSQMAALLSYAWRLKSVEGLSFGASLKVIYHGIGPFGNGWGFGLDLGARYQRKGFMAGLAITDATNTYNAYTFNTKTFEEEFIQTGNALILNSVEVTRPTVRLGLAYDFRLSTRMRLLATADADLYTDGRRVGAIAGNDVLSLDPKAGLEFAYLNPQLRKVAFLRGGFYNLQNVVDENGEDVTGVFPTAGVGFVVRNFTIDYALANIGNFSQNLHSHVVSLKFHIQ